jgi:hypothetical protein
LQPPVSQADVPVLRGLGPQYDEKLHKRHADVLLKVLSDQSSSAAKNIALAGHYGSGKSSVLLGVQQGLTSRNVRWINLSLSSLGIDDTKRARVQDDGTLAPLTNLIQKEIVKQLLYRKAPADMPGSRYYRIDAFPTLRTTQWSVAAAVGFFAIAVLLGTIDRVKKVAPRWLADGHDWAPWIVVALLGAFVGAICFLAARGLHNRVRVDSVSAGGAAVTLSKKENSYFDEYLDEIVYFFQQTKTTVAIFEDLDRFKDPHIFETLRELNTVLNNSEQVAVRPVRFVYAVRDSIFEQLKVDVIPGNDEAAPSELRASAQESAPSSNRTKFFDLVVPMVPFITHRSARDLLAAEFKDSPHKPSAAVINLVGGDRALTDMRLIRNIRNEFEMYRATVLSDKGLQGLTADRLFAMMAYKNTHLEDFEAIRLGTSQIDAAHRAFRDLAKYQVTHQAARSKTALAHAQRSTSWDDAAREAAKRLQRVLPLIHRAGRRGETLIVLPSGQYPLEKLTSGKLWREMFASRANVQVGTHNYGLVTLSFDDFLTLAGDDAAAMEDTVATDVAELQRQSRVALETKEFATKATMAELMARTDLTMPVGVDGEERNLFEIVSDTVSPLSRDLLAKGYIDENFTLYCSDYHDVAISVSAMNFILHCVQADQADALYQFDSPTSIDAVEAEMGDRFLGGESVFNIAVFDHYLSTNRSRLASALGRLSVRANAGDTSFLDLFLQDDAIATRPLLVSELARRWSGLFIYLVANIAPEPAIALLDVAIRNAKRDLDYESSGAIAEFIEKHYSKMSAFAGPMTSSEAANLAYLLAGLDAKIANLCELADAQRVAVIAAGLYPVTRENLVAILGDDVAPTLDAVKVREPDVYTHLVKHLNDYLHTLDDGEPTVEDPAQFLDILNDDLVGTPDQLVRSVARRASAACEIGDLSDLDQAQWHAVVSEGRFRRSAANVSRYFVEHGFEPELAESLVAHDLEDVEEIDEDSRAVLAYALIGASDLERDDRLRLVGQLRLSGYLDPTRLSEEGLTLLAPLVAANEVSDDAATYACIADREFSFREKYFAASSNLPSYVADLAIPSTDLAHMMKSRSVPAAVKRAIADDAEFVAGRLSRQGALAIGEWALNGNEVSTALLSVLGRVGAPAEHILQLLEPHLSTIDQPTLDEILRSLGDEYEPLTRTGRHRPRLKQRPGTERLLDELKARQRVSTYSSETRMLGLGTPTVRVNMRH